MRHDFFTNVKLATITENAECNKRVATAEGLTINKVAGLRLDKP